MTSPFHRFSWLPAVAVLAACSGTPAGPDRRESRTIDLDQSERVRAYLKIRAGELNVRGGAPKLLDATFDYNVADWKPDVQYHSSAGAGDLEITQPGGGSHSGNTRNHWDLAFNNSVPLDMRVELGAGTAQMNLGALNLRGLDVQMGAGTLDLDLRGAPKQDYSVRIRGGVGEATVRVPKDVGVTARASGGIGGIDTRGFHQTSNGAYENDAYGHTPVRIHLDIQGGVGSINLFSE